MRAIEFIKDVTGIIHKRFGTSGRIIDEFWVEFTPDDGLEAGKKTTACIANWVKDTENNRKLVDELIANSIAQKEANNEFDKKTYQIRNRFER